MALQKHSLRNIFPGRRGGIESGLLSGQTYVQKVLSYGPIAYWPLWEAAGVTAECLVNSPAQDGTYTGVTLADTLGPDGVNYAPFFDGANDFVNVFSPVLQAAFNGALGSEGTLMAWWRVANVGVWTDGAHRYAVQFMEDWNLNRISLNRHNVNNQFRFRYRPNGITEEVFRMGESSVAWIHTTITWSNSADEFIAYWSGVQEGAIQAGLVGWTDNIQNEYMGIGTYRTDGGGSNLWHGWVDHVAIWDSALPPASIADLATV